MRWKENDYSRKYDSTPRDPPDLPKTPENDPVQLATIVVRENRQTASITGLERHLSSSRWPAPL